MPTIEIGKFDKVFIVRCQSEVSVNQITELNENDLVLTIQDNGSRIDPETNELIKFVPKTKVYVDGTQVSNLSKVQILVSSDNLTPLMEFSVFSPDAEGVKIHDGMKERFTANLDLLKRLLPFAIIHEIGSNKIEIRTHGINLNTD